MLTNSGLAVCSSQIFKVMHQFHSLQKKALKGIKFDFCLKKIKLLFKLNSFSVKIKIKIIYKDSFKRRILCWRTETSK